MFEKCMLNMYLNVQPRFDFTPVIPFTRCLRIRVRSWGLKWQGEGKYHNIIIRYVTYVRYDKPFVFAGLHCHTPYAKAWSGAM